MLGSCTSGLLPDLFASIISYAICSCTFRDGTRTTPNSPYSSIHIFSTSIASIRYNIPHSILIATLALGVILSFCLPSRELVTLLASNPVDCTVLSLLILPLMLMDTDFWGAIYPTYFAIPHLRKSRGKIVVIASSAGYFPVPRMSFYCASKGAVINFYESLRVELGPDVKITIVTPGLIESEMTKGKFLVKEKKLEVDQELRDVRLKLVQLQLPM
ncbi:hypothetical protein IFM89_014290 [Coptis chinensis]|uniref:Uncharacterized protein n=1 Tax=Coptis chinensis TaxID=261450 RepID=A0A835HVJ8_9MAGN|nr:hypothetical protein IFM89_014290 [Coptis chinensis]